MSVKERRLFKIDQRILEAKTLEKRATSGLQYRLARARTWGFLLYFEFLKNDVAIRAESLSYFTLFSLMPLMAGVFFFLSLFSQWAPVQAEFENLLQNFLQAIPEDQRDTLVNFIYSFKDQYLARLSSESGAIGIFALGVLVWIAGKVFFNLEALMNRIWAVKRDRPFLERIQNFVFCIVIFPLAYIAALSIPGVIEHFGQKKLGLFLHEGIPTFIFFFSLTFIFRYFPNTKVFWKSAFIGALVSTLCFGFSNVFLAIYFKFGTGTGYGKAAILPIFAFFIYVAWIIFILGAEVSLLCQMEVHYEMKRFPKTTLSQALVLERVLQTLSLRFNTGAGLLTAEELVKQLDVSLSDIEIVLRFLKKQNVLSYVSASAVERDRGTAKLVLSKAVSEADLIGLIKDFLDLTQISQNFDVKGLLSLIK